MKIKLAKCQRPGGGPHEACLCMLCRKAIHETSDHFYAGKQNRNVCRLCSVAASLIDE